MLVSGDLLQKERAAMTRVRLLAIILLCGIIGCDTPSSTEPRDGQVRVDTKVGNIIMSAEPEEIRAVQIGIDGPLGGGSCIEKAVAEIGRPEASFDDTLIGWQIVVGAPGKQQSTIDMAARRIDLKDTSPSSLSYGAAHECATAVAFALGCKDYKLIAECPIKGGVTMACEPCDPK
jgi:hypothetical protein